VQNDKTHYKIVARY